MIESSTVVNTEWTAPAVEIVDAPRFAHRGIQLDPARSFVEVDEVKKIIDTMAAFKQSKFHFHLADDQGWRIEITNEGKAADDPVDYTRLHEISGQSAMLSHANAYKSELGRTGYYTQDEYKEIVAYAAERFVTVIPEIDVPGHTKAMLHAIPELNSAGSRPFPTVYGTTLEQNNGNVGESSLDVHNEQTWVSLRHIFGQLADMTPGEYIHIGGDEAFVTSTADFTLFVEKSVELMRDLGKKPIGWTEISYSGKLSEGDVIQYWVGELSHVTNAVNMGARVVASRANAAYLDMKYHPNTPSA